MMENYNVNINFNTNAGDVNQQIDDMNSSLDDMSNSANNATKNQNGLTKSLKDTSNAVLENGGAMGLLNDLTGGYANMVKDAVEASELFSFKKKADTVVTNAQTVATVNSTTAMQQGIINRIKDTAATAASTVAKGVSIAATNVATVAQRLWNAAVTANPLVALVVVLAAAAAAIYKLTSYLINSTEANEKASAAIHKLTSYLIDSTEANKKASAATEANKKKLQEQSIAAERSKNKLKEYNEQQYALAEAAGASSEALRKLKLKHADEEVALNKANATIASNTFIRERNTLAALKAAGVSDEVIAKQEALTKSAYKELQDQNSNLVDSYNKRRAVINKNEVEIIAEKTKKTEEANKAELDRQKEHNKKLAGVGKTAADKAKADKKADDADKKAADAKRLADDMTSASNAVAIIDELKKNLETPAQKEQREYEEKKAILEANNLSTEELTRQHNINLNNIDKEERAKAYDERVKKADEDKDKRKKDFEEEREIASAKIALGQTVLDAAIESTQQEGEVRTALLVTKQVLNAIDLANQIKTDIREGVFRTKRLIGKASESSVDLATGAAKTAAAAPFPANIPLIAGYAATAVGIAMSIKQALSKANVSSSIDAGKGITTAAAAAQPQVSFVSSKENQLATSIVSQTAANKTDQVIKTYVVSKDVTTAQELDRNVISSTTIG